MNDFEKFSKRMDKLSDEMVAKVEKVHRVVALTVARDLIENTPVDEGRARSNWQSSLSSPNKKRREAFAPGVKLGRGESANKSAANDASDAEIAKHIPHQDIYITNNLKYIGSLNDGDSEQQPALFVERAIKRGQSISLDLDL